MEVKKNCYLHTLMEQETNDGHYRWLFLIEGIITLSVGVAACFLMPASAVQTKAWFRPKGWFTDREIGIVVNRVLRDDPSKGDMHNRQSITVPRLWEAITDYDLWPVRTLYFAIVFVTDTEVDLCFGLDCIYSPVSSIYISDADLARTWLYSSKDSLTSPN
jgi:hypothetical protein